VVTRFTVEPRAVARGWTVALAWEASGATNTVVLPGPVTVLDPAQGILFTPALRVGG
jgi:hypothetical protein